MDVSVVTTIGALSSLVDGTLANILSYAVDAVDNAEYPNTRVVDVRTTISKFSLVCRRWAEILCKRECWEDLPLFFSNLFEDTRLWISSGNNDLGIGSNFFVRSNLGKWELTKWLNAWRGAKYVCLDKEVDSGIVRLYYRKNADSVQVPTVLSWSSLMDLIRSGANNDSDSSSESDDSSTKAGKEYLFWVEHRQREFLFSTGISFSDVEQDSESISEEAFGPPEEGLDYDCVD